MDLNVIKKCYLLGAIVGFGHGFVAVHTSIYAKIQRYMLLRGSIVPLPMNECSTKSAKLNRYFTEIKDT
jgi:hypothetical protein